MCVRVEGEVRSGREREPGGKTIFKKYSPQEPSTDKSQFLQS